MERQIICPECGDPLSLPVPETAFERFCMVCDAVWDIRTKEEQDAE